MVVEIYASGKKFKVRQTGVVEQPAPGTKGDYAIKKVDTKEILDTYDTRGDAVNAVLAHNASAVINHSFSDAELK